MSRNYIFGGAMTIDVGNDATPAAFVEDCDGNGLPLTDSVESIVLAQSRVFGCTDVIVSHRNTSGEEPRTAADVAAARLKPYVVAEGFFV